MKWIIIYLLSLSSICKVDSQAKYFGATGTYIISAICKDGIVSGSDGMTRFYLHDFKLGKNKEIGYFNSGIKIIRYNNILISTAGEDFFDKFSIYGLIKEFEKGTSKKAVEVNNLFSLLSTFAKKTLSEVGYQRFYNNKWIISGYKGIIPYVAFYHAGEIKIITSPDYINNAPNHYDIKKILEENNVDFVSKFTKTLIENVIKQDFRTVGGNISIWKNKNGIISSSNSSYTYQYRNINEFVEACKSHKIKMIYYSDYDKKLFENFLKVMSSKSQ